MKPVLLYDGQCGFCRRWVDRWKIATCDRIDYSPFQESADRFPKIDSQSFKDAVHLVEPDGRVSYGAHAVFRSLALGAGKRLPLWCYEHLPGFAPLTVLAYHWIARCRPLLSLLTLLCWGSRNARPSYVLTGALFTQCVGLIYFTAFASLSVQIIGLVGENGILPARQFLDAVQQRFPEDYFVQFPTLAWLGARDGSIRIMCWSGMALSILAIFRIAPAPVLFLLWTLYLSLCTVGQTFLQFQWDNLLLEVGFLAIFFTPWRLWPRVANDPPPSSAALWLLRWLLFRLMFLSGYTKILGGDPCWRDLTALDYHYWTQPLPTWIGWYAHQLPQSIQRLSTAVMFMIELYVPFLIFLPRMFRLSAFVALVTLQVAILLTGNYTYFNYLTIVLCLTLLDDQMILLLFPRRFRSAFSSREPFRRAFKLRWLVTLPLFAIIVSSSAILMNLRIKPNWQPPTWTQRPLAWIQRFRSINTYGLFVHMTKLRREIILEGSDDGRTWLTYEFHWKPGDPSRRPAFVAPHQPRLDWQMWFAALRTYQREQWFQSFMRKVINGESTVVALLKHNPFPDQPPRFLRAKFFNYQFTNRVSKAQLGQWWVRNELGHYAPTLRR